MLLNCKPIYLLTVHETDGFCSVLFVIVLVFFAMNLHKHRVAGKPFLLGSTGSAQASTAAKPAIVSTSPEESSASKGEWSVPAAQTTEKKVDSETASKTDAVALV